MRIACYPGSFDPITNGHVDIALRALNMFDKLYIIVSNNSEKTHYYFTEQERIQICKEVFKKYKNIEVISQGGLTAHQFAEVNQYLCKEVDMVFLMARKEFSFISSTRVKEIYHYTKDVAHLVPSPVLEAFRIKNKN